MYEVIDKFNYIRTKWFNRDNNRSIFGLIHNELVIIDQREMVIISCVADKFLRIFPAVYKTDNGEQILALTLYIGDSNPITIFPEKFIAMTYLLSTLDMLNYANMAFSTASLRVEPINRVSFVEDKSDSFEPPTTSKIGREFKFKQDANNII